MPCNYNPITGEVESLHERYQREWEFEQACLQEYSTEEIMLWQSIEEKIDRFKERMLDETEN